MIFRYILIGLSLFLILCCSKEKSSKNENIVQDSIIKDTVLPLNSDTISDVNFDDIFFKLNELDTITAKMVSNYRDDTKKPVYPFYKLTTRQIDHIFGITNDKLGITDLGGYYNGNDYGQYILSKHSSLADSIDALIFLFWDDCIFSGYLVTVKNYKKIDMVNIFEGISCSSGESEWENGKRVEDEKEYLMTRFTSDSTFNSIFVRRYLWEFKYKKVLPIYTVNDSVFTEYLIKPNGEIKSDRHVYLEDGIKK